MAPRLIDQMLSAEENARTSMQRISASIAEVLERSNKVLFNVETRVQQGSNTKTSNNDVTYNLRVEEQNALIKIIQEFERIVKYEKQMSKERTYSSLDGCMAQRQHADFVISTLRKVIALINSVNQIEHRLLERQNAEQQSLDNDEQETSNE